MATKQIKKRYTKYKSSGIDWLGNIPEHWEAKRLKYSTSINDETLPETLSSDYELLYVDIGSVDRVKGIVKKELLVFEEAPSRARRVVRDGDTIISTVRTYLKAIAPVEEPEDNLIVSTGFAVVRPKDINPHYLSYALRTSYFIETVVSRSVGVSYPAINASELGDIKVLLPDADEQQAIADFLDAETGRIDELIGKKRQFIERLKEKRTVLISHAVTKGLNPTIKLKSSGIDWLGDVPEHWVIKAIKWDTPVQRGASPRPIDDPSYFDDEGEYAWVRISDVTASNVYLETTRQRLSELGASLSVKMQPGKLFLSIAGSVGKPCISNIKCCIHDGFVYFPRLSILPKFLYYIFASGEPYKGLGKMGTQLNLNTDTVASIKIGFPSSDEQESIVNYLDFETGKIDGLVGKVEKAVKKLQEYRSAVISAAVTGEIDVREVV